MVPGSPHGTPPSQTELDDAFSAATRADLRREGDRVLVLPAARLPELARLVRIGEGTAHPPFSDPPRALEIQLERGGEALGKLLVFRDASVRWLEWAAAAPVADPAALRAWIDELAGDEGGPLDGAPPGSELVAQNDGGAYRRLCSDGRSAFAVDGSEIVRLDKVRGATTLTRAMMPSTALMVRGAELWYEDRGRLRSIPVDGGEPRPRWRPLSGLSAWRLRRALRDFAVERDAALARELPPDAPQLPLEPARDACDAVATFGGELPAELALGSIWACDVAGRRLHEIRQGAGARAIDLDGRPVLVALAGGVVVVAVRRGAETAIISVAPGGAPRPVAVLGGPWTPLSVLPVGGELWLRLRAPGGDRLVAVAW